MKPIFARQQARTGWLLQDSPLLDLDFFAERYYWDKRRHNLSEIPFTGGGNSTYVSADRILRAGIAGVARRHYDIDTGRPLGLYTEGPRINIALWSDDLTQAATWIKTTMTAAMTATGPDGVANSATTLTAGAANDTILQTIVSGSGPRIASCYIKRRTGSGTINITQDNGTTWTAVTVTTAWTRVVSTAQTTANPTIGLRIVTSGDAVDVMGFQNEVAASGTCGVSSLARTTTVSVTKVEDAMILPCSAFGLVGTPGITCYAEWSTPVASATGISNLNITAGGTAESFEMLMSSSNHAFVIRAGSSVVVNQSGGAVTANVFSKYAAAIELNNARHAVNGTLQSTDNTTCTKPAVTNLWVGRVSTTPNTQNSNYLRRLTIWGKRLPNETLAAVTV